MSEVARVREKRGSDQEEEGLYGGTWRGWMWETRSIGCVRRRWRERDGTWERLDPRGR